MNYEKEKQIAEDKLAEGYGCVVFSETDSNFTFIYTSNGVEIENARAKFKDSCCICIKWFIYCCNNPF